LPTISIENIETSYSNAGIIRGTLTSPLVNQFTEIDDPYTEFPKGISIFMFDENRKVTSTLRANYTKYWQKKMLWEARNKVIITNIDGDTLRTELLFGDEKSQKIYTSEYVEISKSDGTIIRGRNGFESNTSFTIYKFRDVTGVVNVKDLPKDSVKNE